MPCRTWSGLRRGIRTPCASTGPHAPCRQRRASGCQGPACGERVAAIGASRWGVAGGRCARACTRWRPRREAREVHGSSSRSPFLDALPRRTRPQPSRSFPPTTEHRLVRPHRARSCGSRSRHQLELAVTRTGRDTARQRCRRASADSAKTSPDRRGTCRCMLARPRLVGRGGQMSSGWGNARRPAPLGPLAGEPASAEKAASPGALQR